MSLAYLNFADSTIVIGACLLVLEIFQPPSIRQDLHITVTAVILSEAKNLSSSPVKPRLSALKPRQCVNLIGIAGIRSVDA